jgi:hypothetical protein
MGIRCAAAREVSIRQTKRIDAAVQQRMRDALPRRHAPAYTWPTVSEATIMIRCISITALLAFSVGSATAADWPTFKPGNWTFDRTMTGPGPTSEKLSRTECTDPTADQKEQQAMLTAAGCKFTPLTQSGKTYRYSATCKMAGMTTQSDSVLEAESAEAYTITVDSIVDGSKTHEVLRARRIGDCSQ